MGLDVRLHSIFRVCQIMIWPELRFINWPMIALDSFQVLNWRVIWFGPEMTRSITHSLHKLTGWNDQMKITWPSNNFILISDQFLEKYCRPNFTIGSLKKLMNMLAFTSCDGWKWSDSFPQFQFSPLNFLGTRESGVVSHRRHISSAEICRSFHSQSKRKFLIAGNALTTGEWP